MLCPGNSGLPWGPQCKPSWEPPGITSCAETGGKQSFCSLPLFLSMANPIYLNFTCTDTAVVLSTVLSKNTTAPGRFVQFYTFHVRAKEMS